VCSLSVVARCVREARDAADGVAGCVVFAGWRWGVLRDWIGRCGGEGA